VQKYLRLVCVDGGPCTKRGSVRVCADCVDSSRASDGKEAVVDLKAKINLVVAGIEPGGSESARRPVPLPPACLVGLPPSGAGQVPTIVSSRSVGPLQESKTLRLLESWKANISRISYDPPLVASPCQCSFWSARDGQLSICLPFSAISGFSSPICIGGKHWRI